MTLKQPYTDENGKECTWWFGSKFVSCPDFVVKQGSGDDVDVIIVPVMANGNESLQACMLVSLEAATKLYQQLGAVLGDGVIDFGDDHV
mgnify:CR=1 FL=1